MRKLVFGAVLAALSSAAVAQTPQQQQKNDQRWNHCIAVSSTYTAAAAARNVGVDAQAFVNTNAPTTSLSRAQLAGITNDVYFDPRFQNAGGDLLRNQVLNVCMKGPRKAKLAE